MTLLERIQADMIAAMKAKDEVRLNTLRSIKTALERFRTDQQKPITEAVEQSILATLVKQRKEAAEAFLLGQRLLLAAKEETELLIIQAYMLEQATEAHIIEAIDHAFRFTMKFDAKAIGTVIKNARSAPILQGKTVDGKKLSDLAKAKLNYVLSQITES